MFNINKHINENQRLRRSSHWGWKSSPLLHCHLEADSRFPLDQAKHEWPETVLGRTGEATARQHAQFPSVERPEAVANMLKKICNRLASFKATELSASLNGDIDCAYGTKRAWQTVWEKHCKPCRRCLKVIVLNCGSRGNQSAVEMALSHSEAFIMNDSDN